MASDEKCPGFLCASDAADDGGLCRHCSALANLKDRVAHAAVAADRARIAAAIREEHLAIVYGTRDERIEAEKRLLRVVEGG